MRRSLILLLLAGCYDGFETDGGELIAVPEDAVVGAMEGFYPTNPVLRGTELCVDLKCGDNPSCPGDEAVDACFQSAASGALSVTGEHCVEAVAAGEADWVFQTLDCGEAHYPGDPDQVTLTVVDPAQTTAHLEQWVEALAPGSTVAVGGSFPRDWTVPDGEPFRVVDGGYLQLPVVLSHPDHSAAVAYNDARATFELAGAEGDITLERPSPGVVRIEAAAGSQADLRMAASAQPWQVAELLGVEDAPASIELVAALVEDEGSTAPLGIRAVVRDEAGNLVHGTPVSWYVTQGDLAIAPGGDLPGEDYAELRDACVPPSERAGERTAVIEVRHEGLIDEIEIVWDAAEPDQDDASWVEDPDCQHGAKKGCGCTSTPGPGTGGWVLLGLGALAWRRRRISRSRPWPR